MARHPKKSRGQTGYGSRRSDINLLGYGKSIIDLDAEIPNRALDLGMSQQELNRPQVARSSIDQRSFRAAEGMGTKQPRV
jgi:hypothetical protein